MVFDYKILPIIKEDIDSPYGVHGLPRRRKTITRKLKRDRRKSSYDRRKGVRDGVIVSLSFQSNRRKMRERRIIAGKRKKPGFRGGIVV